MNAIFMWVRATINWRSFVSLVQATNLRMTKINSIGFCSNCFIYFAFVSCALLLGAAAITGGVRDVLLSLRALQFTRKQFRFQWAFIFI